jgi:hypothetical protein
VSRKKSAKDRVVRISVSLQPRHVAFLEANATLFGSTSAAVARAVEELMRNVAKKPEAYTVKPVLPKSGGRD